MLKGFVDAYKALNDENHLTIALQNANFIIEKLWNSDGNLSRTYKNGKATINGYLEDYVHVMEAFISLYEVTFDEKWLHHSKDLAHHCLDYFYDEKEQFFRFTSRQDSDLITPHFEVEDNVIPAANSVIANVLFKLSIYFENSYFEKISRQMLQHILPTIDYPSAFSNWLNLLLNFSEQQKEIAICGEKAIEFGTKINQYYLPNAIIAGSKNVSKLPFLENRFTENETLLYLCQNRTCQKPTDNLEEILIELKMQS
jgi:hypothetical protein